eukprot:scaffold249627_cov22-Tisochrysis_lutea.AAC.4
MSAVLLVHVARRYEGDNTLSDLIEDKVGRRRPINECRAQWRLRENANISGSTSRTCFVWTRPTHAVRIRFPVQPGASAAGQGAALASRGAPQASHH